MAKRINYQIGITADTKQFDAQLKQVFTSLQSLSEKVSISPEIREASAAARELQTILRNATNPDTKKLDLTSFNDQLKQGGLSLESYYQKMSMAGSAGQKAFLDLAQAISAAETPLKRTNKLMDDLWTTMKNTVRWQITSTALNAFTGALQTAYGYSKSLDGSLNNIRIVTSKSAEDMANFAAQANKAAQALSTTTTDYTNASLIYYQQGLSDEQVAERTDTTIKMANVSRQTAEETSEQLTAIWNNFYEEGGPALEYYADVMVALGAATASSSDEIAEGIQKFAAAGKTVGLSYEYAAAALATLTANTRESASVVGTSLRTLFTRLQGLQLGETLEDGVDLNKYSQALDKVGVEILDVNGNLKEMDNILNETAERWSTLTRAEQMALAQTVAGVRQYTQFINLMENWGDFQANLTIARGSEGALQQQADIYAESWESARDRVRAAAENIYDSLINPDFFIGMDKLFTPVLNGVANILDGMGGLSGLLPVLASLMNQVYGDRIAANIRNMAANIGFLKDSDEQSIRILRQKSNELAKQMMMQRVSDERRVQDVTLEEWIAYRNLVAQEQLIDLQNKAAEYAKGLTESQAQALKNSLDSVAAQQQILGLYAEQTAELEKQVQLAEREVLGRAKSGEKDDSWRSGSTFYETETTVKKAGRKKITETSLTTVKEEFAGIEDIVSRIAGRKLEDAFASPGEALKVLVSELKKASAEMAKYNVLADLITKNHTDESITRVAQALKIVGSAVDEIDIERITNPKIISEKIGEIQSRLDVLGKAANAVSKNQFGHQTQSVSKLQDAVEELTKKMGVYNLELRDTEELSNRVNEAIDNNTYAVRHWTNDLIDLADGLNGVFMVGSAVGAIFDSLNNKDLTIWERLSRATSSLMTALYGLTQITKGATIAKQGLNWVQNRLTGTTIRQLAAQTGLNAAMTASTGIVKTLTFLLGGWHWIVTALVFVGDLLIKGLTAQTEAEEKQLETAKKLTEQYAELKGAYEELKDSLANYQSARNGIDELIKGTDEWEEAVGKLNQQVLQLLALYPELSQYVTSEDGIFTISEEGQQALSEKQQGKVNSAQQASFRAESISARNTGRQQYQEFFDQERETDLAWISAEGIKEVFSALERSGEDFFNASAEQLGKLLPEEILPSYNYILEDLANNMGEYWQAYNIAKNTDNTIGLYQQEIGRIGVQQAGYTDHEYSDAIIALAANAINEAANQVNVNKSDEFFEDWYRDFAGLDEDADVDIDVARETYRIEQVDKDKLVNEMVNLVEATSESIQGSPEVKEAAVNLVSGIYNPDNLTEESLGQLKGISEDKWNEQATGISWEEFQNRLATLSDNWTTGYNKVLDEASASVKTALDEVGAESLELGEVKEISEVFSLAEGYGKLNEAIAAYKTRALDAFAEELQRFIDGTTNFAQVYSDIHDIIDGIETGDTISAEEYEKLDAESQTYFAHMLDGTWKLIENAEKLRETAQGDLLGDLDETLAQDRQTKANYERIQGYDFEGLSYKRTSKGNVAKQLDILRTLGGSEIQAQVSDWEKINNSARDGLSETDLQRISEEVQKCSQAYQNLGDSISAVDEKIFGTKMAIASQYTNFEDLREALDRGRIGIEAYSQAVLDLEKVTDAELLDPEEWEEFADYLHDAKEELEDVSDEMDMDSARTLARSIMKMNDGYEQLIENFEIWESVLKSGDKETKAYASAINDCREAVALLLDTNKDFVSNEFVSEHLDLISEAANGSKSAIDELKAALAEDVIANIAVEAPNPDEIYEKWSTVKSKLDALGDIELGATVDDADFISSLNELVAASGMTVNQVNTLLDGMGYEATYAEEPQEVNSYIPEYTTYFAPDPSMDYEDEQNGTIHRAYRQYTVVTGYTKAEGINTVSALDISPPGEGQVPTIETIQKTANSSQITPPSTSGGKGGGGGSPSKPRKVDKPDDSFEKERYHRINRLLEGQSELLDEIDNQINRTYGRDKLNAFQRKEAEINKEIEYQVEKLAEAQDWLVKDKDALNAFLTEQGDPEINALWFGGEIDNYNELEALQEQRYNAGKQAYEQYLDYYNALSSEQQEAEEDEFEARTARWEETAALWEKFQELVAQYEETLSLERELTQSILDNRRALADLKLEDINYRLEIVLDVKDMRDGINDFWEEFYSTQGDYLSYFKPFELEGLSLISREAALFDDYLEKWNGLQEMLNDPYADYDSTIQEIQNLQDEMLASAGAIVEWANTIEDIIPDAVAAASDRFAQFTDQLDHNVSVLQSIKELYALQGVIYKTDKGFKTLQDNMSKQLDAQTAGAMLQKEWADNAEQRLRQAQTDLEVYEAYLNSLPERTAEHDNEYDRLKKARDAFLEEFNAAQEAYLALAQQAMETAREMFVDQIEKAKYDFGQVLSDGLGLDLLSEKYDHYIEEEERYLDKVNEAYEVTAWYNKLQQDIDEATNATTRERLKALQEEINIRRENGKLSQYDLDILEAKYSVLQAQIALEDAQNAKNNLQLVRDRQGNWNYQYTANPDDIDAAQQKVAETQNEWYNIAKEQTKETTGEIVAEWQECMNKIAELFLDEGLTEEEKYDRIIETYTYYTDKIKFLEEEKQIAIKDMTQAGNESLLTDAILMGDTITDLTGLTSADVQKIIEDGGGNIKNILSGNSEDIKNIVYENTGLIDLFENTYAKDLDKMTDNTDEFAKLLEKYIDQCQTSFTDYEDTVKDVADKTGTELGELALETDKVAESTDQLLLKGQPLADQLYAQMDAAILLSEELSTLAQAYLDVATAMGRVAQEQADTVSAQVGGYNKNSDYMAIIEYGKAHGLLSDSQISRLNERRENKIAGEGLGEDEYVLRGSEAWEHINSIERGSGGYEHFASEDDFLRAFESAMMNHYDEQFTSERQGLSETVLTDMAQDLAGSAVSTTLDILTGTAVTGNKLLSMANIGTELADKWSAVKTILVEKKETTQTIYMDMENAFPNAVDGPGIVAALENTFGSLSNDASQYANLRR